MLLPYNTDAPLYYFPFATIGLIAVNALVFVAEVNADPAEVAPWILEFGNGLHPLQWLSNNFLHADWLHLIGNMFFLWGFGLVVEGKLGWWKFLLIYLTMALLYGVVIQLVMLGADPNESPGALGASGVIFGLMAISLIWAPKNEMNCVVTIAPVLMWRMGSLLVDVPIVGFATGYLILQVAFAWWGGFSMSSEMLHLTGAAVGTVYGIALLKLDWVDCEGWDAFSVWQGKTAAPLLSERSAEAQLSAKQPAPAAPAVSKEKAQFVANALQNCLVANDAAGAARLYEKQRTMHPDWSLAEPQLMQVIKSLHKQQLWSAAIRPMVDYLRQFPDRSLKMRLKLADILISVERRPAKALRVLARIQAAALPAELQSVHNKLIARAKKLLEDADVEVGDGEEW